MSLSNFFFGDVDDDPIFGHNMRQMNRMLSNMNNMLTDPFGTSMFSPPGFDMGMGMQMMNPMMMSPMSRQQQSFPGMNLNRLLSNGPGGNGMSYSSSSVFSVSSSGPDGRPQVYQETRAIRNGPGGVRESVQTVQDSVSGRKKMSIGHHIGERGHVVEKEQNLHTGEREEREDFINLDEEEGEEFERDFSNKTRQLAGGSRRHCQIEEISSEPLPAIQSAEDIQRQQQQQHRNRMSATNTTTPRRSYTTTRPSLSPLALPPASSSSSRHDIETSVHPHPYNPQSRKNHRSSKMKNQQQHHH